MILSDPALKSLPGMGPGIEIIDEGDNGIDAMAKIPKLFPRAMKPLQVHLPPDFLFSVVPFGYPYCLLCLVRIYSQKILSRSEL